MATYYQHEKFINLCRAAKEMRAVLGDELYKTEIKAVLQPFNRVGRSIGLTHVRGKDIEAATAALRQKTADFIKANEHVDALVERAMIESWCKKNGYALVKMETLNRWLCYDRIGGTKVEVEIEEILASSLDKPKSVG